MHLKGAAEIMFPLLSHCVQLLQKEMFIKGPAYSLKQCRHGRVAPTSTAAVRRTVTTEKSSLFSLIEKIKISHFSIFFISGLYFSLYFL